MGTFAARAKRILFIAYLLALHAVLIFLLADRYILQRFLQKDWKPQATADPQLQPSPFPTPEPETTPIPQPEETTSPVSTPQTQIGSKILIPVQGVRPEQLIDTFTQSRSEGRIHNAIDIMAPAGTPVIAAADGEIVKFHDSVQGGTTIYQISLDKKYFFYYAHLQRRADGIAEKQLVKAGTVIGYVGDTGNAGAGNYHLHFSISAVVDPNRFWDGISIDPYQVLKGEATLQ